MRPGDGRVSSTSTLLFSGGGNRLYSDLITLSKTILGLEDLHLRINEGQITGLLNDINRYIGELLSGNSANQTNLITKVEQLDAIFKPIIIALKEAERKTGNDIFKAATYSGALAHIQKDLSAIKTEADKAIKRHTHKIKGPGDNLAKHDTPRPQIHA